MDEILYSENLKTQWRRNLFCEGSWRARTQWYSLTEVWKVSFTCMTWCPHTRTPLRQNHAELPWPGELFGLGRGASNYWQTWGLEWPEDDDNLATQNHRITSSNRHAHVLSRARTPIWTQCWKPCSDGLMPWMRHGWRVDGTVATCEHSISTAWLPQESLLQPPAELTIRLAESLASRNWINGWIKGMMIEKCMTINGRNGGISEESVRNQVIFGHLNSKQLAEWLLRLETKVVSELRPYPRMAITWTRFVYTCFTCCSYSHTLTIL